MSSSNSSLASCMQPFAVATARVEGCLQFYKTEFQRTRYNHCSNGRNYRFSASMSETRMLLMLLLWGLLLWVFGIHLLCYINWLNCQNCRDSQKSAKNPSSYVKNPQISSKIVKSWQRSTKILKESTKFVKNPFKILKKPQKSSKFVRNPNKIIKIPSKILKESTKLTKILEES